MGGSRPRRGGGGRTAPAAGLCRPCHLHPFHDFADRAPHVPDASTFGRWTPALADRVVPHGRLVLSGVSTDCCVLSTALAAADAGTEVLVVADACAGADDDSHVRALKVMELYRPLVRVTTVTELLGD